MEFFENLRKKFIHANIVNPLAQGEAHATIRELEQQGISVTPDMARLIGASSFPN